MVFDILSTVTIICYIILYYFLSKTTTVLVPTYYTLIIIYAQKVVARAHDVIIYEFNHNINFGQYFFFIHTVVYIMRIQPYTRYNVYLLYSNRPTLEKNNVGNCTIE